MPSTWRRRRAREPGAPYLALPRVMVDSNVLIDIFDDDPAWFDWSFEQLGPLLEAERAVINPLIYAELAAPFSSIETLERRLAQHPVQREALPWDAAFMAAQAHKLYRRRGGVKRSPLPDFADDRPRVSPRSLPRRASFPPPPVAGGGRGEGVSLTCYAFE